MLIEISERIRVNLLNPRLNKNLVFSFFVGVFFSVCFEAFSQQPVPAVRAFKVLVSEWVDIKQEIGNERQKWEQQKVHLEEEYTLLLKEKKLLKQEIVRLEKETTSAEKEHAELIQKKERSQKALNDMSPVLSRAEAVLSAWRNIIPCALLLPVEKYFESLETGALRGVSQRLQLILALYGDIDKLGKNVYAVEEVLETDSGQKREFDVIYLGMARGFCVSKANRYAGIGAPYNDGWKWEWDNSIAAAVRKGIDVYKKNGIAEFVTLPLQIKEVRQ